MSRPGIIVMAGALAAALHPTTALAQGYRLRVDVRGQSVASRGFTHDSIAAGEVVIGPTGGPRTPDGFAVTCLEGAAFCAYFRPGPEIDGQVVTTTADVTAWGFGVPGLSVRGRGRLGLDVGDANVWPGTDPALQIFEAYVEYAGRQVTARAGRQFVTSRLGWTGFDGGLLTYRAPDLGLGIDGYAGWSLAQGAAVPASSPSLNPLDEFQPRERHMVAGASAGWRRGPAALGVRYEREVDPASNKFIAERAAADAAIRGPLGLNLNAGADYDIAAGLWGNAEASLAFARDLVAARAGARQYRPHYPLWTIWGAFSPVPYNAAFGTVRLGPYLGVSVRASGETYDFDDARAETPLVREETSGWRWALGAGYAAGAWRVDVGYRRERGPGAAAEGLETTVTYTPSQRLTLGARAGSLFRPLEFRYSDADLWLAGLDAAYRASERIRATVGAVYYDEQRERPDAAAFSWSQVRLTAGLSLLFGTPADRGALPEAIGRMPEAGAR